MSEDMLDGEIVTPFDEVHIPVTYYKTMSRLDYRIDRALKIMKKEEKEELLNKYITEILKHRMKEEAIRDLLFND